MSEASTNQDQVPMGLRVSKVISWLMYAWTVYGVAVLVLRVFLLAAGANLNNGFANFVMQVSTDYLKPFWGIFPPAKLTDASYFDVSAIFAIIVYLFVGWAFHALVGFIQRKIDENTAATEKAEQARMASRANTVTIRTTKNVRNK